MTHGIDSLKTKQFYTWNNPSHNLLSSNPLSAFITASLSLNDQIFLYPLPIPSLPVDDPRLPDDLITHWSMLSYCWQLQTSNSETGIMLFPFHYSLDNVLCICQLMKTPTQRLKRFVTKTCAGLWRIVFLWIIHSWELSTTKTLPSNS